MKQISKYVKGNSNFELGTAICYVKVENYFLTIIKHIAVPSSKLEFPIIQLMDLWKGARLEHCFHQIQLDTFYQPIWKKFYLYFFCTHARILHKEWQIFIRYGIFTTFSSHNLKITLLPLEYNIKVSYCMVYEVAQTVWK